MNFSGGQRQRLAIARAVIRRPAIYLFDDAFSALDVHTDARVRAALRDVSATATVMIVSQRISTVAEADQIVVIDDAPYQVVDIEYWARRLGSSDRRLVWPTVYVVPVRSEDWKQRLERRVPRDDEGKPPTRY